MFEELAWEVFQLTGDIREYLLYKNLDLPENHSQADIKEPK